MKKVLKYLVCCVALVVTSSYNTAFGAGVVLDAHSAGNGLSTWNLTTTHANELIIISVGGYGVGGSSLSTAAGTVTVNGTNATYETRALWLSANFSWNADIWAYVAPVAATYTITCTEAGIISPYYFNFAASVYDPGCTLSLADVVIGGNNDNQSLTTITASITTPIANCWVYGTVNNNDNGGTGIVAFNNQLTLLNKTYISNGIDGAQADSTYPVAGTYNITTTDLGASNVWMTFALIAVKPVCVLPVELLNFECASANNGIKLNWSTATETNSSRYTIERSYDGIEFAPIATITAAGNSESQRNYTYTDENPLPGVNYYRLTETDRDGSSQTFNTTQCSQDEIYNEIYPNPNNGSFTVSLGPSLSSQTVVVFDVAGREVLNQQFEPNTAGANYSLNLPQGKNGMFIAKILNGSQVVAVKKVVVY